MSETQVLMSFPIFRFSGFCSRNNFLEGGFTFQCGDVFFSWEEASFLSEGVLHGNGIGFDGGGLQKKNNRMGGGEGTLLCFCSSTAPSPFNDVLHEIFAGNLESKNFKTGGIVTRFFKMSISCLWIFSKLHTEPFSNNLHKCMV